MLKLLTVWITTNWKILKEMGIPDYLTCLLRNLYADREATVRTLQETQEIRAQSLGQEGLLEKEMATHSGILAWEILWTEEAGGLQSMGLQRVRHD